MKAISIRQPWAWLILNAGKDIENRTWPTSVRGRVLIHAASSMTQEEYLDAHYFAFKLNPSMAQRIPIMKSLERGGIVGEVEIVNCMVKAYSQWFSGPYGFVLRNPKPLPFVPCKGRLGFFNADLP